jgi:hypothetical protein
MKCVAWLQVGRNDRWLTFQEKQRKLEFFFGSQMMKMSVYGSDA